MVSEHVSPTWSVMRLVPHYRHGACVDGPQVEVIRLQANPATGCGARPR